MMTTQMMKKLVTINENVAPEGRVINSVQKVAIGGITPSGVIGKWDNVSGNLISVQMELQASVEESQTSSRINHPCWK
jgi:hypothetical protein